MPNRKPSQPIAAPNADATATAANTPSHVPIRRQRHGEESGERQRDHDPPASGHAAPQRDHWRCPIRPCGRSTSTAINSAKENMLFIDGANRKPASASETPIRTPPTSAPAIDPMPPMMTMMKAMSV